MLIQLVEARDRHQARRCGARLVSALLLGGNVIVPRAATSAATSSTSRPAARATQTGCVSRTRPSTRRPPPTRSSVAPMPGSTGARRWQRRGRHRGAVRESRRARRRRRDRARLLPDPPAARRSSVARSRRAVAPSPDAVGHATPACTSACRDENGASWLQVDDQRRPATCGPQLDQQPGRDVGPPPRRRQHRPGRSGGARPPPGPGLEPEALSPVRPSGPRTRAGGPRARRRPPPAARGRTPRACAARARSSGDRRRARSR